MVGMAQASGTPQTRETTLHSSLRFPCWHWPVPHSCALPAASGWHSAVHGGQGTSIRHVTDAGNDLAPVLGTAVFALRRLPERPRSTVLRPQPA